MFRVFPEAINPCFTVSHFQIHPHVMHITDMERLFREASVYVSPGSPLKSGMAMGADVMEVAGNAVEWASE